MDYSTSFEKVPNIWSPSFLGQKFDRNGNNRYRIRVLHGNLSQDEAVIVKYERFSMGNLGPNDGFNCVSFEVNGNTNPTLNQVNLFLLKNEPFQDVYVNFYGNWQPRVPVVFSMRPLDNPNLVLGYLIVFLEEFFQIQNTSFFSETIEVSSYDVCNLLYKSFVYQNYDDNFMQSQRPDSIPVRFIGNTGITQARMFDVTLTPRFVNQRLFDIFKNYNVDLAAIARVANVSESGIYNIYAWGSSLFGLQDENSDVDLIVVADSPVAVKEIKALGLDIAIYTPQRFQSEIESIVVPMSESMSALSDRVFTVYNMTDPSNIKYKILERITFFSTNSKAEIKDAAGRFKEEKWSSIEEAFFKSDVTAWKKRLWITIRNLVFFAQIMKDNRITDVTAANSYLEDIRSKSFDTYPKLYDYFYPKIQNLYSTLLSL